MSAFSIGILPPSSCPRRAGGPILWTGGQTAGKSLNNKAEMDDNPNGGRLLDGFPRPAGARAPRLVGGRTGGLAARPAGGRNGGKGHPQVRGPRGLALVGSGWRAYV